MAFNALFNSFFLEPQVDLLETIIPSLFKAFNNTSLLIGVEMLTNVEIPLSRLILASGILAIVLYF